MTRHQCLELELAHLQREARTKLALSQQTTSLAERASYLSELRRIEARAAEIQTLLEQEPATAA